MHVNIGRPEADCAATARHLIKAGHDVASFIGARPVVEPLKTAVVAAGAVEEVSASSRLARTQPVPQGRSAGTH